MIDWNGTTIERLRTLWDRGMSTGAIAAEMGTTKNAVVGKAHRLGLDRRPSPILRDGVKKPPAILRAPKVTLPVLSAPPLPPPPPPPPPVTERAVLTLLPHDRRAAPAQKPAITLPPVACVPEKMVTAPPLFAIAPSAKRRCAFPLWANGSDGRRQNYPTCDQPAVRGSYCADHAKRCFDGVTHRLPRAPAE